MYRESGGPVAPGSAWRAFFNTWQLFTAAQSSTVSPRPSLPTPPAPYTEPSLALSMYSVVPAMSAEAPPLDAPVCWLYGRNPEPVITTYLPAASTTWPTAGSDHVC